MQANTYVYLLCGQALACWCIIDPVISFAQKFYFQPISLKNARSKKSKVCQQGLAAALFWYDRFLHISSQILKSISYQIEIDVHNFWLLDGLRNGQKWVQNSGKLLRKENIPTKISLRYQTLAQLHKVDPNTTLFCTFLLLEKGFTMEQQYGESIHKSKVLLSIKHSYFISNQNCFETCMFH